MKLSGAGAGGATAETGADDGAGGAGAFVDAAGRAAPGFGTSTHFRPRTVASRAAERPAGSYTTGLLEGGVDTVGRKVTEEATEVLIAAKDDAAAEAAGADRGPTRAALAGEAADLVFHAFVLLAERGMTPAAVVEVLRARHRR